VVIGSASPAVAFDLNDDSAGGFTQLELVRILIVDDFASWRRAIHSILAKDEDLEVVGEASDGLEAVQKSEELQPDLVLLDIQLPKMNGLDAARLIHKVSPTTRILFVSSYHHLEIMQEALRVGAGFVVKADASRDLLPIVKAIVRNEPFVGFKFLLDTPWNPGEM
jgi:DNA-binding NarL/FixJ family response regulator